MIRALLLIPLLFLLNSCIEGEEEIWIDADASGKIIAHYELPSAVAARMGPPGVYRRELARIDEEEDGIQINNLQFGFVKSKLVIHLEIEFDNALDLLPISERQGEKFARETGMPPSELETFLGGIDVRVGNMRANYSRSMDLGPMFPRIVRDNPKVLDDSAFRFIMHLPFAAESSDAHTVSDGRKTLEWNFLLQDYVSKPIQMSFVSKSLVPWWAWVLGVILLLIVVIVILLVLKRVKRSRST